MKNYDGGGQDARTRGTTPLVTGRDRATCRGRKEGGVLEPRTRNPEGFTGTLETSRAANGGIQDGGRGRRNRLVVRGCRGGQGPGEQVKGNKTASTEKSGVDRR